MVVEGEIFYDRFTAIKDIIVGKRVLDVGCLGVTEEELKLHEKIRDAASYCVGLDNKTLVEELAGREWKVACADAESFDLDERFDVVFGGEVIEHLANPGAFLESARGHLVDGGRIILTTPNPYYLGRVLRAFLGIGQNVNPEHTHWHCMITLPQLLRRYGFSIEKIAWLQYRSRWWMNEVTRFRRDFARAFLVVAGR